MQKCILLANLLLYQDVIQVQSRDRFLASPGLDADRMSYFVQRFIQKVVSLLALEEKESWTIMSESGLCQRKSKQSLGAMIYVSWLLLSSHSLTPLPFPPLPSPSPPPYLIVQSSNYLLWVCWSIQVRKHHGIRVAIICKCEVVILIFL